MRKEKKPLHSKTELPPMKGNLADQILRNIEEENEMFDDHGHVIIGARDKKPIMPKPKKEED